MSLHDLAGALERARTVLQRRPDLGLHEDAPATAIWQAGTHDNPFGQRLTAFMISKKIPDASVPMSLLADHPNVQFNYYRGGLGSCEIEMH